MPRLDFYSDRKLFVRIKLGDKSILIGRGIECDIQFPSERVSRHHARVEPGEAGSYWIEDLSVNGTRLNFSMLEERSRFDPGDRIYIEDCVIIFQPDGAPDEALEEETTRT